MALNIRTVDPVSGPEERRESERHAARMRTATLESDIFIETVPLVDIGRLGFSARTLVGYPQGCRLTLHITGQEPMRAYAVWHGRGRVGARFDEPLEDELLLTLIVAD
jgi:hypothetical protein